MEFNWEEISKKITNAADYTVRQTEKLTAMARLEYKLANTKNKLNQLYQNLGKLKFSEIAGEEIAPDVYAVQYDKIVSMLTSIEEMEVELAKLRNYRFCIACGAKIGNDMIFCPKCGTRQTPVDEEEANTPAALLEAAGEGSKDAEVQIAPENEVQDAE